MAELRKGMTFDELHHWARFRAEFGFPCDLRAGLSGRKAKPNYIEGDANMAAAMRARYGG